MAGAVNTLCVYTYAHANPNNTPISLILVIPSAIATRDSTGVPDSAALVRLL